MLIEDKIYKSYYFNFNSCSSFVIKNFKFLKGAVWLKALFLKYQAKISFHQKMTHLSWSPLIQHFSRIFG